MKSCWVRTVDGRTEFEFRDLPVPRAGPGQLVVRVRAAGLNRGELIVGGVMHGGAEKPGGTEAAGEIHELGEGVQGLARGERVMGRVLGAGRGAFAEFAVMDATEAMAVPPRLTWEQAAAIPVNFMVAEDALVGYGRLQPGECVLITGVSSATGVACMLAAKCLGARVIGTSSSTAKLARLASAGLDVGVAARGADFAGRVKSATDGRGADLAVNCVGGSVFRECMSALAFGGRLATVGYVDGVLRSEIDLQALHAGRLVLYGVSNSRLDAAGRARTVQGFVRDLLPAVAAGRLSPLVDRVFAFNELPAAKRYMESNAQVGKIVIQGP